MGRFIVKRPQHRPVDRQIYNLGRQSNMGISSISTEKKEIKTEEIQEVMDTKTKVAMASAILEADSQKPKVKRVKRDLGLIEREDKGTIILTEDNKELLHD